MFSYAQAAWYRQTLIIVATFAIGVASSELFSFLSFSGLARLMVDALLYVESDKHLYAAAKIIGVSLAAIALVIAAFSIPRLTGTRLLRFAWHAAQPRNEQVPRVDREMIVERVSDGLEEQLNKLVETVGRYLQTSQVQSDNYEGVRASLTTANTAEKVEAIVSALLEVNAQGQRDVEQLRTSLNEAKVQSAELRNRLEKTEQLVSLDPLTALPNRRHFDTFLSDAIEEAHRKYLPLCVVMADIDHFKRLNDTFGHQTGDAVLKRFAQLVKSDVRSTDLVARYGGEEFVVVLKSSPLGTAFEVAESIRAKIASSRWTDPLTGKNLGSVTASFGVAEIRDGESAEQLIDRADKELYAAKKDGRNRVIIARQRQPRIAA